MKALLLILLLLPMVAADQFGVGLTVQPCTVDFTQYEQLSAAYPNSSAVQLRTNLSVGSNSTCSVILPVAFRNATNFTAVHNNTNVSVNRTGNTISWNAIAVANSSIYFIAPAPTISSSDAITDKYRKNIVVAAATNLRNSSYNVTVPNSVTGIHLFEQLNGTLIERTTTYSLVVNGTQASFTNVYFTDAAQQRTLYLEGIVSSSGSSTNPPPRASRMAFAFPDQLTAVRGETAEATVIANNYGSTSRTITIKSSPHPAELTITPQTQLITTDIMGVFTIRYTPGASSTEQIVTLQAIGSQNVLEEHTVRLTPQDKVQYATLSTKLTPEGLLIEGGAEGSSVYVFLRTDTGSIVREKTLSMQELYSYTFDLTNLPGGTYEACIRAAPTDLASEKCSSVQIPAPAEREEPAAPKNNSMLVIGAAIAITLALVLIFRVLFKFWR
jgi:hypothetical protein